MPDASAHDSSLHFADDLRRIREGRGVLLDDLHEETKIPLSLLEQFEQTGLFDHPMFNRVYLRSLVRAYADRVGIPTEIALDALDQALAHTYAGHLAAEYLTPPPEAVAEEDEAFARESLSPADADATFLTDSNESDDWTPGPEEFVFREGEVDDEAWSTEGGYREGEAAAEETPVGASVPETTPQVQKPPRTRHRLSGGASRPIKLGGPSPMLLLVGLGALVLIGGLIWGILALTGDEEGADDAMAQARADSTAAADSAAARIEEEARQVTGLAVGDTINVVVLAANGVVDPIKITRDGDLRRPYWIERGDAKSFPATDLIVLEDRLDVIRLFVEGYEYPTSARDSLGRIVITKETAQAFADTLSGEPVRLSITPQNVPIGPIGRQ